MQPSATVGKSGRFKGLEDDQQRDAEGPQDDDRASRHQVAGEMGNRLGHIRADVIHSPAQDGEEVAVAVMVQPGVRLLDAPDVADAQHTDAHHRGDGAQRAESAVGKPNCRVKSTGNVVDHIVKDSYANSLVPFLTANYAAVDVVDLRNYNYGLDALIEANGYDAILLLYSFDSFKADPYLYRAGIEG